MLHRVNLNQVVEFRYTVFERNSFDLTEQMMNTTSLLLCRTGKIDFEAGLVCLYELNFDQVLALGIKI